MTAALEEIVQQLIVSGVAERSQLQGCSDAEIEALEAELGIVLPRAYREFLLTMGRSAGDFFCGTDFLYADLPLREYADELLSEGDVPLALHPADFVFAMHQGYTFLFFRCGISDDPPVFLYEEDRTSFERVADSFSAWLALAAKDEIDAKNALRT